MTHTPYDGSAKPFTIGLKPLDLTEWIEIDEKFDLYLAEKKRLYAEEWANVYAAILNMESAELEVLELLTQHLTRDRYDGMELPALARAGLLVQEDLVIMAKRDGEWVLAAASLCFPSAWKLREKIGKPMHDVHGPVPGFNKGTRNAGLISRMFDHLRVEQPVIRWNWTVFGEATLHLPMAENSMTRRFGDGEIAENVFLRLERQTLRKLPRTGEILFTIRTHVDPLEVLAKHPDGAELRRAIAEQVRAFTPEELTYKGLTQDRDRLLARLALP